MTAHFTDRELDIMQVLWRQGPSTVSEVQAVLDEGLAYTTVLTILRTLEAKGHVDHVGEGRAHRYHAVVTEEAARRSAVSRLVDRVFGGSVESMLTQLIADRRLKPADLENLRKLVEQRTKGEKKR